MIEPTLSTRAKLLSGDGHYEIGWVPDCLVEHFHALRDLDGVNPS
jgi:hypothetical protein